MDVSKLFIEILSFCNKQKYPDIHLSSGKKPFIRFNNGELNILEKITSEAGENIDIPVLDKNDVYDIITIIAWDKWWNDFLNNLELDISYNYKNIDRYRVNCYMDTNGYSVAMRIIPKEIPTMEQLWLGDTIKELCKKPKGLILVTWPTWAWKSTNLAAMIDFINTNFKKHIITIEDPVEFAFDSKLSLVNQRELWNSTKSFSVAMKSILREDPNVIMIWEMRDPETIKTAITLAETGHLVLSTLHTNDTVQTIDRIIDVFPSGQQEQIRMQLSMSLLAVVSQRLVPRVDAQWRVWAREILINNDAVRNLIISWKTHQLYSVIELGQKSWMILMDKYLLLLFQKWIISKETLLSYARDKEILEMSI